MQCTVALKCKAVFFVVVFLTHIELYSAMPLLLPVKLFK